MELTDLHKQVLSWCVDDDTMLWNIASIVAREAGLNLNAQATTPQWVQDKSLAVIEDLLRSGLIEAQQPIDNLGHFRRVETPIPEFIAAAREEWAHLQRRLDPGEISWFRATPKGEDVARSLGLL